jgi:DNA invertase Pin-like site-specific DNA recombinase
MNPTPPTTTQDAGGGTGRTKRAVIYLRVSTAKQAAKDEGDGYSLPAQKEACHRKAEQLGAEVVAEFIDRGESAKTADRPQFQRMLAFVKDSGDIDYVILDKVDRFARNRRDDANTLFELRLAGAQLVSVKENIDETPAGQLLHAIMAGIAEFYSKNLGAEALKGMTQKAKVGGTPGRAPIGYLNTRRRGQDGREIRTVVVDPERAPLVQWAFEAYATGEWTIRTLTEALAAKGLRALPHGGKLPGPVQPSHVAHLLANRYYLGLVTFKGEEYQGRHQPLVPQSLFDRVQEVLRMHNTAGEKRREHNHYLKSTVSCGHCGSRLCLTNAKGTYLYFFCVGHQQRRTTCPQRYLPAEAVEAAVERYYTTVRLPEAVQQTIQGGLRAELDHQQQQAAPEMAWARTRVVELEAERRRLGRAVVTGAIPEDIAREEQTRITAELKQAQKILATAEVVYERIEDTLTRALTLVGRCEEVYRHGGPQVRRLSNQFFFGKLLITEDDTDGATVTTATLRQPWATLLAEDFQAAMAHNTTNPDRDLVGRGSKMMTLVHLRDSLSNPGAPLLRLVIAFHGGATSVGEEAKAALIAQTGASDSTLVRMEIKENRKLSPGEIEELVSAYVAGASILELRRRFGVHEQTVRRWLVKREVAIRPMSAFTDAQEREVVRLYVVEQRSLAEIAPLFGVSAGGVRKALVRRGVERRAQARRKEGS